MKCDKSKLVKRLTVIALLAACNPSVPSGEAGPSGASSAPAKTVPAVSSAARPADETLGRAGSVSMDLAEYRIAVEEARILNTWRLGKPPDAAALSSFPVRRRLLTQALEARVVREEALSRGLAPTPEELERVLLLALAGKSPDTPPTMERPPAVPDLDAALAARYAADPARVRRVATDQVLFRKLAESLLDQTDPAVLQTAWADANTRFRVDVLRVSRVPTATELDRAVRELARDVTEYYAAHVANFNTPEKAAIEGVVVPVADSATPGERETARVRAEALRARAVAGESLDQLAAEVSPEGARRGGKLGTVSRKAFPAAFDHPEGQLTPVVAHARGWAFYKAVRRYPAVERPLSDPRVQREIAATLLRDRDALPHARGVAERLRTLLIQAPGGEALSALVAQERVRRATTEPFNRAGPPTVPGVGIAPDLFRAVFALTPEAPVSAIFTVRQEYVVVRLVDGQRADPKDWPAARAAFTEAWRDRKRPTIVEEWISTRLAGDRLWVDGPRLESLTLADLGLPPLP